VVEGESGRRREGEGEGVDEGGVEGVGVDEGEGKGGLEVVEMSTCMAS